MSLLRWLFGPRVPTGPQENAHVYAYNAHREIEYERSMWEVRERLIAAGAKAKKEMRRRERQRERSKKKIALRLLGVTRRPKRVAKYYHFTQF